MKKKIKYSTEYNSEVKLSPEDRKFLMDFLIYTWTEACLCNGITKAGAIKSLVRYMKEVGAAKDYSAKRVLKFFTEQGMSENEILDLWRLLMQE